MSEPSKGHVTCDEFRQQLPTFLYDEVEFEQKRSLEEHLRGCESCRAELEAHRRTMHLLDRWTLEAGQPAPVLPWTIEPRGRPFGWLRPLLVGTAAAVLAFAALTLWGVSISRSNGQWIVALGRGGQYPVRMADTLLPGQRPVIQSMVDNAMDSRLRAVLEALEADLVEVVSAQHRQRLLLVNAVQEVRDADLRRFGAVIDAMVRRQEEADQNVERLQADMVAWRNALNRRLDTTTGTKNVKEES